MWKETHEYSALIGGIVYKNVKNPIVVNGKSLISFSRNQVSKNLGASLEIHDENGCPIGCVINNEVCDLNEKYLTYRGMNRVSIINEKTGQVFLDLTFGIQDRKYELELSFLCIFDNYPLILHPERTKCGTFNDNNAPNISRLTLTANKGSQGGGIALSNSKIYLLGICIENLMRGISVTVESTNETE